MAEKQIVKLFGCNLCNLKFPSKEKREEHSWKMHDKEMEVLAAKAYNMKWKRECEAKE
jgi:hypothetical protein